MENKFGRTYQPGKCLSKDFQNVIVNELVNNCNGCKDTGAVKRGSITSTAEKYKVSKATVSNIWRVYCAGGSTRSSNVAASKGRPRKLTSQDIDFIGYMKNQRPSFTSELIHSELMSVSSTVVTPRTVRMAVQKYLPTPYTVKRIKHVASERITLGNLMYTEAYMNILYQEDPYRLRFMDESGFRLPEASRPLYGHAPKGERAIEVLRYASKPNASLHLIAGLNGVGHLKVTSGGTDSYTFVDFITECTNTVTLFGVPALRPGDILVVDNAPIHHSQIARVLKQWLMQRGIDVVFTPTYSPDMNPVEQCFSKIKHVLRQPCYGRLLQDNFHLAIYRAAAEITVSDMHGYFRATKYLAV